MSDKKTKIKTVDVLCPKCSKKIGSANIRVKGIQFYNCRTCNKRIWYHGDTGECEVKEMPQRQSSSGITFV